MESIFIIDGKKIKHLTIKGKMIVENERIKNQEKENKWSESEIGKGGIQSPERD